MAETNTSGGPRPSPKIPDHVPPDLVIDVRDLIAPTSELEPYSMFKGELPKIFYSPTIAPRDFEKGTWVVTRNDDIRGVYQNTDLYSNADVASFQTLVGETFRMIPIAVDPPDHAKYRLLLNPVFSPKRLSDLEEKARAFITRLIDGFIDRGECDVAYDFGRLYPVQVFLDLMGFPQKDLETFLEWENAILHSHDLEQMRWGLRSAFAYLRAFIEEVRKRPDDTVSSLVVHGRIEAEDRPLNDEEIMGAMSLLWLGGLDTVASTTSLIFRRLVLFPDLQQKLRDNPKLIPDAIEEFLRMQPLVNSTRLVKKDHTLLGMTIKAGDHIQCMNAAGNFDPNEFEDPWEFRIERGANRHFTFGGGPHRCLGSHLARRELRVAIEEFLSRVPPFKLKPGARLEAVPALIAMPHLPIVWPA